MAQAGQNPELLRELEVAKVLANILKTNVHVATSLGPYYVIQVCHGPILYSISARQKILILSLSLSLARSLSLNGINVAWRILWRFAASVPILQRRHLAGGRKRRTASD